MTQRQTRSVFAQPLYFGSADAELFGWLHEPSGQAQSPWGLVLCKPFGYEAACAHRSVRAWAERCAALGFPALRFDYAGAGDSADPVAGAETEQLGLWSRGIGAAVRALQDRCRVEHVALLGIRLGATAAALAAVEHPEVQALLTVVPVADGRRHLRELHTLQERAAPEALEVNGFRLSAATVKRLAELDLAKLEPPKARHVLLLDRADLPGAARSRWAIALRERGIEVEHQALPGYVEMMSTPHASLIPERMLEMSLRWLGSLAARPILTSNPLVAPVAASTPLATSPAAVISPALTGEAAAGEAGEAGALARAGATSVAEPLRVWDERGTAVLERPLFLDSERSLFAILSEPDAPAPPQGRATVILLNGGATHHIGPNRMYVSLARRWAADGYAVLRMDLPGLGDSGTRPERPPNEVYPPAAVEDVSTAIRALQERGSVKGLTLAGLCSGAYHCLRCAVAGLPVERILMINPLTFFWREGMTLSDLQDAEVLRGPAVYRERVRSRKSWKKLLTGRVDLRPVARTLAHRGWMAFDSLRRDVARSLRIRLADDLGWELEELTARGVRAAFFFARGDAGVALLKLQAGSALRRLRNRCHIHCVDGADHIFSQSAPRALLERLLEQELIGADPSVPFSGAPPRPHSGPPRERPLHRWRARHLKTA